MYHFAEFSYDTLNVNIYTVADYISVIISAEILKDFCSVSNLVLFA